MTPAENICSLCIRTYVKSYHLKDSISAPNDLRFEGHTNLQAVLEKILNKKGKCRRASNQICQNCRDKLHGIYSFTHQHSESKKIFHQITDVTVRLKKFKTFFLLTDLKTEYEAIANTDKDVDSLGYSSTVADIECDDSVVSKVVVKNEFDSNFEGMTGTVFSKLTKELNFGLLSGEYSNADGTSVEKMKIDSIGNTDREQITIEEEIIKEEWTMQEAEIFEAKVKRDVLGREQTKVSGDICDEVFGTASCLSEHTKIVHENDSQDFNHADAEHNTEKEGHTQRLHIMKKFACDKCDVKYKNKRSLWAHKMTHLGARVKCNKCDQHFHSKHALVDHKRAHCVALFECDMCSAKFKYKGNFEKHKLCHTNELLGSTYYCCNTKFTTRASFRHHICARLCESYKCDVKLRNKKSLRSHLKMVHPIKNYSCDQCEKKFKFKQSLKVHKQSHAGVVFKCDHCDATYKSKQSLKSHKQSVDGIIFNCDQCDAIFKSFGGLRQHRITHTGVTFTCQQCDASFSYKSSLRNHKRLVHTDVMFSCDHCDATYKSKHNLKVHQLTHNRILFNCDQCDAKYKTNEGLRHHKMSHTGVSFTGNQCDASFPNKIGLKNHRRVHTDAVFSCDHCDATYKSKRSLKLHKQSVDGIFFNCDQCDAKYKTSGGLRDHKMSHTDVTFTCDQCDASFSNKRSLKTHLRRVHTDLVFSCDHCDVTYKSKHYLKVHKLSHNGIFNCDQCDAKYKTNEGLRHHKMTHTGMTFACNKCDASFLYKSNLTRHSRDVHTGAVFSCDHCDATYKRRQSLNRHKQIHNGI